MLDRGDMEVAAGEAEATGLFSIDKAPPLGDGVVIEAGNLWPPVGVLEAAANTWLKSFVLFEDLAVMVISGLGEGSLDLAFLALLAAARTSAMELLNVRGMAPVDSVDLNS